MLLFGGSLPDAWDAAATAVRAGRVGTLVLVGGVGHTTDVLRALLDDAHGATEADLMAAYLRREHGIEDALLERRSSNCGENVVLARDLVRAAGLTPRTVALVQDPTMQRRMDAVFRLVWPGALGGQPARPAARPVRVAGRALGGAGDGRGAAAPRRRRRLRAARPRLPGPRRRPAGGRDGVRRAARRTPGLAAAPRDNGFTPKPGRCEASLS